MPSVRTIVSRTALVGGLGVLAAAPATPQQQVSPPIARYTVDVGTISGMGAMGQGGGLGAAMAMMRGGGGQVAHEMLLRLGSSRTSTGAPKADHFLPNGMRMSASVPLIAPERQRPTEGGPAQLPKMRLLLFWGCGERAPRGQPVVIDFSKLAQGQVPPDLYFAGLNLPDDWKVLVSNSTTYGEWPNGRDNKSVQPNSSLIGAHRIASTYAPEINFTLAQDFMGPLNPSSSVTAANAVAVNWTGLPNANGYYAWAFGAKDMQGNGQPTEMVWWSSSATRQFGGALAEWMAPSTVRRLVDQKVVMPPTQTSCTIPAEVKAAAGDMLMTQLYAYGPQADFAFPPRPADPKVAWRPEWIARVRYRSSAMVMAGMPGMGGMGGGDAQEESPQAQQQSAPAQPALPACPRGLRGVAMRAAKLCF